MGTLHVKVIRATKLKKALLGASDPYVEIKMTDTFVVKDLETRALQFTVYDWEQVPYVCRV